MVITLDITVTAESYLTDAKLADVLAALPGVVQIVHNGTVLVESMQRDGLGQAACFCADGIDGQESGIEHYHDEEPGNYEDNGTYNISNGIPGY